MSLRLIGATAVCLLALCACAEALVCAACTGTCPKPPDCPLGREPCGCCDVCALTMGQMCHGYSPGCGDGLMCLTPVGPFPKAPPPGSGIHGRCVLSSIPNFSPSTNLAPTLPTCGDGLMCLTPVGPFPKAPPPGSGIHGRCVLSSIPNFSPSTHLAPTLPSTYPVPTIPGGGVHSTPTIPPPVPTIPANATIAPKMVG